MFDSLRHLSDKQIVSGSQAARVQEHDGMLSLVGYLVEVERRQIHLKLGYSSLFKYCTELLGHSEAEAMLRITAARCVVKHPEVYSLLESRDINLSTISRVAKILTGENCAALLGRIKKKSLREVEAIAAEYEPELTLPRDRVRTVVVRVPVAQAKVIKQAEQVVEIARAEDPVSEHLCNSGKESSSVDVPTSASVNSPTLLQLEHRSIIQFCADEEFMSMVEKVRALASHEVSAGAGLQDIMKIALRFYLRHKDPSAREARRESRQRVSASIAASRHESRNIPVRVRDQVFKRDKRCTYVSPGGKRCDSTHVLQIDHVKPAARGGANTIDNLRLLCAYHNRLEAERLMGRRPPL